MRFLFVHRSERGAERKSSTMFLMPSFLVPHLHSSWEAGGHLLVLKHWQKNPDSERDARIQWRVCKGLTMLIHFHFVSGAVSDIERQLDHNPSAMCTCSLIRCAGAFVFHIFSSSTVCPVQPSEIDKHLYTVPLKTLMALAAMTWCAKSATLCDPMCQWVLTLDVPRLLISHF